MQIQKMLFFNNKKIDILKCHFIFQKQIYKYIE